MQAGSSVCGIGFPPPRSNPRMQATGRGGSELLVGAALPGAKQWKRCGRGPEGLQLIRTSSDSAFPSFLARADGVTLPSWREASW
jgi:hypothetical protein